MSVPQHRLVLVWSLSGIVAPLALGGLAWSFGQVGFGLAHQLFMGTTLLVFPFWLLLWLVLAAPNDWLLGLALLLISLLLNGAMFALVGLLHRRISEWPVPSKVPTLLVALAACIVLAYAALYFVS